MPKFSVQVALMGPEYRPVSFGPGDDVPDWALDLVGAHVLEPEDIDDDGANDESQGEDRGDDGDNDADEDGDGEESTPPPADDQPDFTAPAPARRGRSRKQ